MNLEPWAFQFQFYPAGSKTQKREDHCVQTSHTMSPSAVLRGSSLSLGVVPCYRHTMLPFEVGTLWRCHWERVCYYSITALVLHHLPLLVLPECSDVSELPWKPLAFDLLFSSQNVHTLTSCNQMAPNIWEQPEWGFSLFSQKYCLHTWISISVTINALLQMN